MSRYASKVLLAMGCLLIGYLLFVTLTKNETDTVKDTSHCPDCGRELPAQARLSGECPYCKLAQVGAAPAGKDKGSRKGADTPLLLPLLGLFVLGSTAVLLYLRLRKSQLEARKAQFVSFHCPSCRRKLRYPSNRAGRQGQCPACKRLCIFPG
jgi:hypothetical protein